MAVSEIDWDNATDTLEFESIQLTFKWGNVEHVPWKWCIYFFNLNLSHFNRAQWRAQWRARPRGSVFGPNPIPKILEHFTPRQWMKPMDFLVDGAGISSFFFGIMNWWCFIFLRGMA